MDRRTIEKIARKLELRDIALDMSELTRNSNVDPDLYPPSVRHQSRVSVTAQELTFADAENVEIPVLRAYVRFMLSAFPRFAEPRSESESADTSDVTLFAITATYRVEYQVKEPLTETEIEQFSQFNVVHNAWPFWRHHVHNVTGLAKLPSIVIPLFHRPAGEKRSNRSPRRRPAQRLTPPRDDGS